MRDLGLGGDDFAAVAAAVLAGGGRLRFRARGASMWPAIRDGDLVTVIPARGADLRPGDVALYRGAGGRPTLHRVVGRAPENGGGDGPGLFARGDAVRGAAETVAADAVWGRVVAVERDGVARDLAGGLGRLAGRVWVRAAPATALVAAALTRGRALAGRGLAAARRQAAWRRLGRAVVQPLVTVRPSWVGDAAGLARLDRLAAPVAGPQAGAAAAVPSAELRGFGVRMVATIGGAVVGAATVRRFPADLTSYPDWWLFDVHVLAPLRGLGVGGALTRGALVWAAAHGATWLRLLVDEGNEPARRLYHKLGFAPAPLAALAAELAAAARAGRPRRVILGRRVAAGAAGEADLRPCRQSVTMEGGRAARASSLPPDRRLALSGAGRSALRELRRAGPRRGPG